MAFTLLVRQPNGTAAAMGTIAGTATGWDPSPSRTGGEAPRTSDARCTCLPLAARVTSAHREARGGPSGDRCITVSVKRPQDVILRRLFRAVCVDELKQPTETLDLPDEYLDGEFRSDYQHADQLFERLGERLDITGKDVIEVGSGLGAVSVRAAEAGASRVVGVEIVPKWVDFANGKVARDYSELRGRLSFALTQGGVEEAGTRVFDVVISHDAFEHYSDPASMLRRFSSLLSEDGLLVLTFAPLWKSPYGAHIIYMTKLPWAHLIFPERIVMAEKRRLLPKENSYRYEDAIGGLNRMTLARFRALMEDSDFRCVYLATNVSEKKVMRLFRAISRVPFLEEYFTHSVYSIWRREGPVSRQPVSVVSGSLQSP